MSIALREQLIKRDERLHRSKKQQEVDVKRKRRTNRMLIAMVTVFVLCWMPLNCAHIIRDLFYFNEALPELDRFQLAMHILAMSSTVYNPFIYACMNEPFRKELKNLLRPIFRRNQGEHSWSMNMRSCTMAGPTTLVPRSPTSTMLLPYEQPRKGEAGLKGDKGISNNSDPTRAQCGQGKEDDVLNESVEGLLSEKTCSEV